MIYAATFLAACILNRKDAKTILFCLLIALTQYLPIDYITDYYIWYMTCIMIDVAVVIFCFTSGLAASLPVQVVTTMLVASHFISVFYVRLPSYEIVAQSLEYMQMLCFVVTSPKIINTIKERMRCLLKFGCGY